MRPAKDRSGGWSFCFCLKLDPNLTIHTMDIGITVSYGIGWSLDDRTMYFTDTRRKMVYAYDYDAATGSIENRRSFIYTPDEEGSPGI